MSEMFETAGGCFDLPQRVCFLVVDHMLPKRLAFCTLDTLCKKQRVVRYNFAHVGFLDSLLGHPLCE